MPLALVNRSASADDKDLMQLGAGWKGLRLPKQAASCPLVLPSSFQLNEYAGTSHRGKSH